MKRIVQIELLGQLFTLRTDTEEHKVLAAGEMIRAKLKEYAEATRSNVKFNVAVLVALDMALEYLQLKETLEELKKNQEDMDERSLRLIKAIEAEAS